MNVYVYMFYLIATGAFYGGGHSVSTTSDTKRDKKQMERDITRSMFSIRVAEVRVSWNKNKCVTESRETACSLFCSASYLFVQPQSTHICVCLNL